MAWLKIGLGAVSSLLDFPLQPSISSTNIFVEHNGVK